MDNEKPVETGKVEAAGQDVAPKNDTAAADPRPGLHGFKVGDLTLDNRASRNGTHGPTDVHSGS